MEQLELLTDEQLRLRLLQYGFANMPVTDTTRKVLIKKLKLAIDGQNTKNRRETVAVSKFSSDDDEPEKPSKREKTPSRRATTAAAMEKVATTNRTLINGNPKVEVKNQTTRRSVKVTPAKEMTSKAPSALIGSDSDDDVPEYIPVARRSRTPSLGKSEIVRTSYKTSEVLEEGTSEEVDGLDDAEQISPPRLSPTLQKTIGHKVFKTAASSSFKVQDIQKPSSFGASLSTSYNPRGSYNFAASHNVHNVEPIELNETNTPYLSNFAKRLSTLKAEPLTAGTESYKYKSSSSWRDNVPSTSLEYAGEYDRKYFKPTPVPVARKGFLKDMANIFDFMDSRYNFRTVLYIIFIVMIVVAIYVVFM